MEWAKIFNIPGLVNPGPPHLSTLGLTITTAVQCHGLDSLGCAFISVVVFRLIHLEAVLNNPMLLRYY